MFLRGGVKFRCVFGKLRSIRVVRPGVREAEADAKVQADIKDEDALKAIKEGVKDKEGKTLMKAAEGVTDDDAKALVQLVRGFKK